MSWVAVGVIAASTAVKLYGDYQADSAEAEAYQANADAAEEMSAYNKLVSQREEEAYMTRYKQAQSSRELAYGKSGVALEGSALDQMAYAASVASQEVGDIRLKGEMNVASLMNEASMANTAADTVLSGQGLQAAGTTLQGASSAYGAYKQS